MRNVVIEQNSSIVYLFANGVWYCYDSAGYTLGDGAMGVVYLGFRCDNQDRVAIKKIKDEYANNRRIRECARNEALMLFSHPNIVRMLGYCEYAEDYGPIYILSEYVPGITFEDHVKMRLSVLPAKDRIYRIVSDLRPILSALQYLHSNSVVHKDIKPSNIMIDSMSKVKLMDLGVSGLFSDSSERILEFVGTPQYAAPEQIPSSGVYGAIDARTDIYAFGVMLYELITGVNPFEGGSYDEILSNQIHKELPNDDVLPPELFEIIRKATAKNPDSRYGSAVEVDADIARFLDPKSTDRTLSKVRVTIVCIMLILLSFIAAALIISSL